MGGRHIGKGQDQLYIPAFGDSSVSGSGYSVVGRFLPPSSVLVVEDLG
jgi:hypothetical protein